MIEPNIKAIAAFLKTQGISCQTLKGTKEFPFDVVFIYPGDLGTDKTLLQLRIAAQDIEQMEQIEGVELNPKGYFHLQFTLPLNVAIKDEAIYELERFLLVLNRSSELPGFEINEVDRLVYYRHAIMISGEGIDPYVLMTDLGIITGFYLTFNDIIKQVASGSLTFQQAVQTICKEVKEGKP